MNKLMFFSLWAVATSLLPVDLNSSNAKISHKENKTIETEHIDPTRSLYEELQLSKILKWEAFEQAMQGYGKLSPKNKDIITIIDFTLPSTDKRMYVIDLKNKKLLYHNIVSHGRNSGEKFATAFSNRHGSYQSSLGFYTTEGTYQGGNGYSLRLNGLEKGINDQALARAIVIHGADYCSENVIRSTGRLGRSYGCPALPRELNKPIINTIKNGSLMFIYAGNKDYLASTKLIKLNPVLQNPTMIAEHTDEIKKDNKAVLN
ncbi:murein L,D-transpeptidase catalytic domain-containing protein [Sphingobacterium hotanense]|uniref:murein L,D-transpeptidase catalytic domain-containing protein n=1 Tax=Sphingobacterium hotanense TaxID=649196 RepID=UPI0021A3909F|nr:murein L,D-transpeptidase catalytic domain family protein [Sphingobacterium hotanense]MCT1524328.1 murein L,D-transpeptidase catalytic domain family protein [Sphingobacterium hotanense]